MIIFDEDLPKESQAFQLFDDSNAVNLRGRDGKPIPIHSPNALRQTVPSRILHRDPAIRFREHIRPRAITAWAGELKGILIGKDGLYFFLGYVHRLPRFDCVGVSRTPCYPVDGRAGRRFGDEFFAVVEEAEQ